MTDRAPADASRWTLASGLFILLLAAAAFLLPVVKWAPAGLVGWLLFLSALAEGAMGRARRGDPIGRAASVSAIITAAAGLLFILFPRAGFFSVANLVTLWLLVRGGLLLMEAWRDRLVPEALWIAVTGGADLLLGLLLVLGLPVVNFVAGLFGTTREIVASFALVLAISFAVTGLCQLAVARSELRRRRMA